MKHILPIIFHARGAAAAYRQHMDTAGKDDPNNFCMPSGIPEKDAVTSPWKIVQIGMATRWLSRPRHQWQGLARHHRPVLFEGLGE
jgi:hypothetical protein